MTRFMFTHYCTSPRPPRNLCVFGILNLLLVWAAPGLRASETTPARERISFNDNWLFAHDDPPDTGTNLNYQSLKPWLLPTGSGLSIVSNSPARPEGNPGGDVP